MKIGETVTVAVISTAIGIVVLYWEFLANAAGFEVHAERRNVDITVDYYIGLVAALFLGYSFPNRPLVCGIWLRLGPILLTHSIYIYQHGVPRLWIAELIVLAVFSLPYIALAYGGAYLRKRWTKN